MVQIETSKNKIYSAKWVSSIMSPDELMIQLPAENRIGDVAADFDGIESFTITNDGVKSVYTGFSRLINATLDSSGLTLNVKRGGA